MKKGITLAELGTRSTRGGNFISWMFSIISLGIVLTGTHAFGKGLETWVSSTPSKYLVDEKDWEIFDASARPMDAALFFIASAPTNLTAKPGVGSAHISFTEPLDNGGSPIINYKFSLDGGAWTAFEPAAKSGAVTIEGLTNCTTYSVRLRAVTAAGDGNPSEAVEVTPLYGQREGITWIARAAAEASDWSSVTYGNGLFVAVASYGANQVMTSPDGITWTARAAAEASDWSSVTYGNGLFVAVASYGANQVMTSPDGITWTARAAAETSDWSSVTYGNGLFVAVASYGANQVMTSPDGITWTAHAAAEASVWRSVTYGNGLFVAVADEGSNQVMISPDGITWTERPAPQQWWNSVTYGNGLYVAVANKTDETLTDQVMTSPDGITWTGGAASEDFNSWNSVTYGNGLFVTVANYVASGTNQVMTSTDGITWTARSTEDYSWRSITYANGRFVAVSDETVMTSEALLVPDTPEITGITAGATSLSVAFTQGSAGGSAITNYEYSLDNGTTWSTPDPAVTGSPLEITGLNPSTSYQVKIRAVNAQGASCESAMEQATTLAETDDCTLTAPEIEGDLTFCEGGSTTLSTAEVVGCSYCWYNADTPGSWNPVGTAGFSGTATYQSLAIAPDGTPYVAYRDGSQSNKTTVMKFNGSGWEVVGTAGFSSGSSLYQSLAIAPDGTPYVAYRDGSQSNKTTVMKFNGSGWEVVGTAGFSSGSSLLPSLAIAPDGTPYVAFAEWQPEFSQSRTTVMKFVGSAWQVVGSAGFSDGTSSFQSLAFHPDGTPYVAYNDNSLGKTTVRKFNGSGWEVVGIAGFSTGTASYQSLAFHPDGTPYVAYQDGSQSNKTTVMKFNGSGWEVVGIAGFSTGTATYQSLEFHPDGTPYVAYQDKLGFISRTTVMKFNGLDWVVVGTLGSSGESTSGNLTYQSLAIDPKTGTPYVAYQDEGSTTVRKFDQPCAGNGSSFTVTAAGSYTFKVMDASGCTATSSVTVTLATLPEITGITAGATSLSVAFTQGSAGGSAITNYEYSLDNGATWSTPNPAVTGSPLEITGLTPSTSYQVKIRAVNAQGASCVAMVEARTLGPPLAPTNLTAKPGVGSAHISFTEPFDNGGSPIINYEYSLDGGEWKPFDPVAKSGAVTIEGLTNCTTYSVRLRAVTTAGDGDPSEPVEVTPQDGQREGKTWTARAAAAANPWSSVTYGNGLFVAVASYGTNQVMTSPDGITWTARAAAENNSWQSVTYGNGRFVAVAGDGTNRVMTSPDGITWTARPAAENNGWRSVTYGNGLFVAVATNGTNRVMTSPDGITWTARAAAAANFWFSVTYGNGQFVAVANTGTNNQVMTSPDGITWTPQTAAAAINWRSVTYGNGLFVAVGSSGTNRVMTSPDGIEWTAHAVPEANAWQSVTYGNGLFVATSESDRVMTSTNGIEWTARAVEFPFSWSSVTYGDGLFVAVDDYGTGLLMTSEALFVPDTPVINGITANATSLSVAFTQGSAGGSAITNYEYSLNGGEDWVGLLPYDTQSPLLIDRLTPSTFYQVMIRAKNAQGYSCESAMVETTTLATCTLTAPQIEGDLTFCEGGSTTLSTAEVVGGSYCWYNADTPASWNLVGATGIGAKYNSLAIAPDGTPYVAYQDKGQDVGFKTTVMKFNSSAWTAVGTASFSAGVASYQSLAIAPDGTPYVAYQDGTQGNKTTVMKFNGSAWEVVGTAGFSAGESLWQSLAISPDGTPYVGYRDAAQSSKTTVMKFNGSAWEVVGTAGFSAGGADYQSLAITPDGTPYVAYRDWGNGNKTTVMKFDGSAWVAVGTAGLSTGQAEYQSLAIDRDGTPYVAYADKVQGDKTTVMKFNGSAWEVVGTAGFSEDWTYKQRLVIAPDGTPYVAYLDGVYDFNGSTKATLMKFDGSVWVPVGSPGFSTGGDYPSLAIASDGTPYVAYTDWEDSDAPATVMKFDLPCAGSGSSFTVSEAGSYTLKVTDASGCTATSSVTVTLASLPEITGITAGLNSLSVAFTPGSEESSAITNYEYSLDGGNWTEFDPADTESPLEITGLTHSTSYEVKIRAVNAQGASCESAIVEATTLIPLTITAASNNKIYDGTALTDSGSSITEGSLVSGHTYTATLTGSQTNVGTSANVASGALIKDGSNIDVTANYAITYVDGTLEVTKATIAGITFEDDSFVYDGTAKSLAITGTLPEGTSVSYSNNSRTNVGSQTATATITGSNYEDLILTATLEVTKATIAGITFEDDSFVYDGTAKSLAITGTLPEGTSVSYSNNSRTNVGSQTATATITGSNYEDLILTATLEVTKATIAGITFEDDSFVYDGTAKSLAITGTLPEGTSVSYSNNSRTNVGSQTATATITGSNYEDLILTATLEVTKATIAGITFEDDSFVYDGTAKSLAITGTLPEGTSVSYSNNSRTNVGSQTATATITGSNYEDLILTATLEVTKATIAGITFEDESFVYDGTAKSLSITGTLPEGTSVSYSNNSRTNVGSQTATATITGSNYEDLILTATLAIIPAPVTITADNKQKTYGESNPTLTFTYSGLVNGDTKVTTEPGIATTATASSNVGTYPITLTGGSDANYTITLVNGTLTVGKKDLTITADDKQKTYGEANPELTFTYSGLVNGDTKVTTEPGIATTATASSNVGTYPITLTGGSDANYTITLVNGTLTVGKKALTITAENKQKTYGEANPELTFTYSGLVNGDTKVTTEPGIATTATASSNVGTYPITLTGGSDANYTITLVNGTLTVGKKDLTITADDKQKTYGEANPELTFTYSGLVNGDTKVTTEPGIATTATASSNVGTYPITLTGGSDANYTITLVNGTLTVGKKALTITAENKQKTYGEANPELTFTYSGLVNGDTKVTTEPGIATTATASSNVGTYPITLTGGSDANYTITLVNGTLTVGKKALTITAENKQKTYGEANPELTFTYSGLVNGDTKVTTEPGIATTATASSNVGTYPITLTGGSDANYTITLVNGTLTVGKKDLTITADDKQKTYGEANPELTFTYSGLVNGDTKVTTEPGIATTATASSNVGTYPITLTGGSDANYTITLVNGTLTVGKKDLTITAENKQKTYGEANPALTFTYSGLVNGDTKVTTEPSIATTATVSSNVGTYPITLTGGEDQNYSITLVNGTLMVGKKALTITADDKQKTYGEANPELTFTYNGLVNGDTKVTTEPDIATTATASSNVGTYPITLTGGSDDNYTITLVNGTLTVGKKALTITANDDSKTYGDEYTFAGTEFTTDGLTNGDGVTSATLTSTGAPATAGVNTYDIMISGAQGTGLANYEITYEKGTLTVGKKALTITAENKQKTYGEANPALTFTYSGLVNGDTKVATEPSIATTATTSSNVGTYPITLSGGEDQNYVITLINGTLAIGKKALTITADDKQKTYGEANPALTFTYSGLVNGDTKVTTEPGIATTATASSNVGTYPITLTGGEDQNYAITLINGTLTIGKKALTITANDDSKTYGDEYTFEGTEFTTDGLTNGDGVTSATLTSTGAPATAGVNTYDIMISGAQGTGFANYEITYEKGTLTVGKKALTITANDDSKTYGDEYTFEGTEFATDGLTNGDGVTSATLTSTGAPATAGVNTYDIMISGAQGTGLANYEITYEKGTLTVGKKALTIAATNKQKTYGEANPALTFTYSGLVNGDTKVTTEPSIATTATASSNVGTYPITLSGGEDQNYAITLINGTLTIGKKALTITATNKQKTYGEANPALTFTYSGLVNGDTKVATEPSIATTATASSNVGTYPITLTGGSDANYTITLVNGTLTVGKKALTITAENKQKTYGEANPVLTFTYSGLVNGDTKVATEPGIATTATASSNVGTYPITLTGGEDQNYAITLINGTLTIGKKALTITATNKQKTYGEANPALTFTYSGLVNGDTKVTTEPSIATTATASSNVGTYPITLSGGEDQNYAITLINGTLTIGKKALTITATNKQKTYGEANPALTFTYSGLVNGDTKVTTEPSIATTATASSNVGTYPITLSGGEDQNYAITIINGTLTIGKKALTIAATNKQKTYGEANPALTFTYSGLVNGDTKVTTEPSIATTATASSNVGTYPITLSGGEDQNYAITLINGTLTIGKKALTITASDKSKIYGEANPALTFTYSGLVNGDTKVATEPGIATTATASSNVGTYPITLTGGSDANYTITLVNGTLTVTPATLNITIDNKSKIFGQTDPVFTYQVNGLKGQDIETNVLSGELKRAVGEVPGNYAIGQGTLKANANYTLTVKAGNLEILAARILSVTEPALQETLWGKNPVLPTQVTVQTTDGQTFEVGVLWNTSGLNVFARGSYTISGTVVLQEGIENPDELGVTMVIRVNAKPAPVDVTLTNNTFAGDETNFFITVGAFQVNDPVDNIHQVELLGAGYDNGYFEIKGNILFWSSAERAEGKTSFTIIVRVTDRDGNTLDKFFEISRTRQELSQIEVYNTFTPDGDGINDTWGIPEIRFYQGASVQVFERSGERVFYTEDPDVRWDGTYKGRELPVGTYYWVLELRETGETRRGMLNLIRD
ncbi:MBG domain-containing protein [Algoriphagus sanaruensis]|uniref:Fibronectin type-III domain-containing protein n=1 Tax=Algoriphagus sanaruensis TaxID=1727163 RepID=A0A142EKF8_9BACT|nr:MBG domain-containing protein [Algoriphagus sanaruensis]AMQ55613.1 hypothetical protein AO498_04295 [Algoriphagus sanaruensis]